MNIEMFKNAEKIEIALGGQSKFAKEGQFLYTEGWTHSTSVVLGQVIVLEEVEEVEQKKEDSFDGRTGSCTETILYRIAPMSRFSVENEQEKIYFLWDGNSLKIKKTEYV